MARAWPAPHAVQAMATAARPTRRIQLCNFGASQLAWFAAVLGAAHGQPLAGTACVLAVTGWHLAVSRRPAQEARLVLLVSLIGAVIETAIVWQGHVRYPSGQPLLQLAPYWMVALWGLLAIALNVNLRWLRERLWLASLLGAVVGPMAFASGVRLGGAQFVHAAPALLSLAGIWAAAMPLLVWVSMRFDGVADLERAHG